LSLSAENANLVLCNEELSDLKL